MLVHGSVTAVARRGARSGAASPRRFELVVLERPGFPPGPAGRARRLRGARRWVAELLEPGDHLVGHSYGGVVALLAAAETPERVRSLTVIEPPCTHGRARPSRRSPRSRAAARSCGRTARATTRRRSCAASSRPSARTSTRPRRCRRSSSRARARSSRSAGRGRRRSRSTDLAAARVPEARRLGRPPRRVRRDLRRARARPRRPSGSCSRASATTRSCTRTSTPRSRTSSSARRVH